jgi:hypothetical protein
VLLGGLALAVVLGLAIFAGGVAVGSRAGRAGGVGGPGSIMQQGQSAPDGFGRRGGPGRGRMMPRGAGGTTQQTTPQSQLQDQQGSAQGQSAPDGFDQ